MTDFEIRPLRPADEGWVAHFVAERWGAEIVVVHGETYRPQQLPGFLALEEGETVGLITYHVAGDGCEIVTLDSLRPSQGIGGALIGAVQATARAAGCWRLWLITTNDNLDALRFYQRHGFELVAVHRGAVNASRLVKPEIPLVGAYGIPIRDEIELEMALASP